MERFWIILVVVGGDHTFRCTFFWLYVHQLESNLLLLVNSLFTCYITLVLSTGIDSLVKTNHSTKVVWSKLKLFCPCDAICPI